MTWTASRHTGQGRQLPLCTACAAALRGEVYQREIPRAQHASCAAAQPDAIIDALFRLREPVSKPVGEQSPEGGTALLIAALNHAWTVYGTRINRAYQLPNYYLVASAIVATAYASAINGKHYGLAAMFSVAGVGLSALAFAVGLDEKRTADKAEAALITLQDQIASKLDIDSIHIVKAAGNERARMTVVLPAAGLIALLGIGTLLYALIH
jgi:hypothetical protein